MEFIYVPDVSTPGWECVCVWGGGALFPVGDRASDRRRTPTRRQQQKIGAEPGEFVLPSTRQRPTKLSAAQIISGTTTAQQQDVTLCVCVCEGVVLLVVLEEL